MANRLQIRRGTGAPGGVFYEGEPIFDKTGKILYVGDSGAAGTGAGTSIASGVAYDTVLEMLTQAASSSAGTIKFQENGSNGNHYIGLTAPASVSSNFTFVLPDGDGFANQVLKTDGSGNLGFSTVVSSFNIAADSGNPDLVNTGETITFAGTANEIDTTVTNNQIQFGLPNTVTVTTGLNINSDSKLSLSETTINQNTGDLTIQTNGAGDATGDDIIIKAHDDVEIQVAAGTTAIYATGGGSVKLNHNGSTKLETTAAGVIVTGITTSTSFVKASNSGGFLKADGTEDTNTYLTAESDTLDSVTGRGNTTSNNISVGIITATSLVKSGGQSTEFLKADGSVDTNTYLTSYTETQTLDDVTTLGNTTTNNIDVGEVTADGLTVTGISTLTNQAEVRSNDGSQGRIDFYCEVNNAHYTRVQAAAHSDYSGNATVTLPSSSGTLLLTDGDGSSLTNVDAITLGGISSTSFLRSDAVDIKTSGNLTFNDSIEARFGTSGDLQIGHDGTDSHIKSVDKDLNIELAPDGANPKIYIRPTQTTQGITLGGGSGNPVELYHTNLKKFETTSSGASVTGDLYVSGNLNVVGTAVTFSTETVKVEDRMMELGLVDGAEPTSATTWELGVLFNYHSGGSAKKSGVVWLNNQFVGVAASVTESADTGTANPQVTIDTFAPIAASDLYLGGTQSTNQIINSSGEAVNLIFDGGSY